MQTRPILFTIFLIWTITSNDSLAQKALQQKPLIKNYGVPSLGEGLGINYTGLVLSNNNLLFANDKGILQYDGTHWDILFDDDSTEVISLLTKDSLIYVGGNNYIGNLSYKDEGRTTYSQMQQYSTNKNDFGRVFQIIDGSNNVYFQSYGTIFNLEGGTQLREINIGDAYIFYVDTTLFASIYNKGLAIINNDNSFVLINKQFRFKEDAAFGIFKTPDSLYYNIITGENGIYKYNRLDHSIKKLTTEVSKLFEKEGFYFGQQYLDSLWVATTWNGAVVIYNDKGNIKRIIDNSVGITGKFLRELFIDNRNKIWVTSDVGISEIYWPEFDTLSEANLHIYKIKINDKPINESDIKDSLYQEKSNISIDLAVNGFNKNELSYSYKVNNEKWSDWTPHNYLTLNSLSGGKYTIQFKAKTVTKIQTKPISINIHIKTPWYKSITGILFILIASIGLVFFLIWARTLRLKVINTRLEHLVNDRTKELVEKSKALEHINGELKIKNQELDQFVYRSSHDLIAPLKSLKGLIYIARNDHPSTNQLEYLMHMNKSVEKLEEFIHSIIDYTTNANTQPKQEKLNINSLIDELVIELKYFDKAEEVKLNRNFKIPEFECDVKRLKIILSNLLTNAVKYHNYNQTLPYIEIRTSIKDSNLCIEIEDNGKGIHPDMRSKIFDMFYRASDDSEGSGLGLYIVKDTVAKMGGTISVNSTLGKGTTFTILLHNVVY